MPLNLRDAIAAPPPQPWAGGGLPWNDESFSQRMLAEHLSQAHDAASRRHSIIDIQVGYLHTEVLGGRGSRILDLGCGPGFYCDRLQELGHHCCGIDFSPAAIRYARKHTQAGVEYREKDLRDGGYGEAFDLAMMLHGEFNAFSPEEARRILAESCAALRPGGRLVLEVHSDDDVRGKGHRGRSWYGASQGIFSADPYLVLHETFCDAATRAATDRWLVIAEDTHAVSEYRSSLQAYSEAEYRDVLATAGYVGVELRDNLGDRQSGYCVLCASVPG